MNSFWKRTLAVVLSLCMIMGYLPFQAKAEEEDPDINEYQSNWTLYAEEDHVTLEPGETADLVAVVECDIPDAVFTYLWKKDSVELEEASNRLNVSEAGVYTCEVSSEHDDVVPPTDMLTFYVSAPPVDDDFDAWPVEPSVIGLTEGDLATMTVETRYNSGPITYQWYEDVANLVEPNNWQPIEGANESSLTVTFYGDKEYYCLVTDNYSLETKEIHFCVSSMNVQCEGGYYASREYGGSVTFKLTASSNTPYGISYTWYRNGEEAGHDSELPISNCTENEAITCEITDGVANVTRHFSLALISDVSNLSIGTTNISVDPGEEVWYRFVPQETGDYDFSWSGEGNLYVTYTGLTYPELGSWSGQEVTDSRYFEAGEYYYFSFTFEDGGGNVVFTIREHSEDFVVGSEHENYYISAGETLTLNADVFSTSTLSYQWSRNGVEIEGATESTLPVAKSGNYSCYVTDENNHSATVYRDVTVSDYYINISFSADPGLTVPYGSSLTLTLVEDPQNEADIVKCEWYYYDSDNNKIIIEDTYGLTCTFNDVFAGMQPYVYYEDSYGNVGYTSPGRVSIENGFSAFVSGSSYVKVLPGQSAELAVIAECTDGPIYYQWYKDQNGWVPCEEESGANTDVLTTLAITSFTHFWCKVTDKYQNEIDIYIDVYVDTGFHAEAASPQLVTVSAGGSAELAVHGESNLPLTYEWNRNGETIGTDATVTISDVSSFEEVTCRVDDGYNYQYIWFNIYVGTQAGMLSDTPITVNENGQGVVVVSYTAPYSADYHVCYSGDSCILSKYEYDLSCPEGWYLEGENEERQLWLNKGDSYYFVLSFEESSGEGSGEIWISMDSELSAEISGESSFDSGSSTTLYVNVNSTSDNLSYQWYRDGELLDGETESSITVSVPGNYSCYITDDLGNTCDVAMAVSMNSNVEFYLTTDPYFEGESMEYGSSFTIHPVFVNGGEGNYTYQWYFMSDRDALSNQSVLLENETQDHYDVVSLSQSGWYRLLITDEYGNVFENSIRTMVGNGLGAMYDTLDVRVPLHGDKDIQVQGVVEDGPITYEWYEKVQVGPDSFELNFLGNGNQYHIEDVTTRGTFVCLLIDKYGTILTVEFLVTVDTGFSVVSATPQAIAISSGESITLRVIADTHSQLGLTYCWHHVYGEETSNTDSFTLNNITSYDEVYCDVSDGYNSTTIRYKILVDQAILELPEDEFTVSGNSDRDVWYQYEAPYSTRYQVNISSDSDVWIYIYDNNLTGTNSVWSGSGEDVVYLEGERTYYFVFEFSEGTGEELYSVTVSMEPILYLEAYDTSDGYYYLEKGDSCELSVYAYGSSSNISYQWYRNGTLLEGETESELSVSLAGWYYCVVSDDQGHSVTCREVRVNVNTYVPLTLSVDPYDSDKYPAGSSITMCAYINEEASTGGELSYQWYYQPWNSSEEQPIQGATTTEYTISSLTERGRYTFRIMDEYGNVFEEYREIGVENGFGVRSTSDTEVSVLPGNSTTLEVNADADDGEISYQWYIMVPNDEYGQDWEILTGETGNTLLVENVTEYHEYLCKLHDIYGNNAEVVFRVSVDTGFHADPVGGLIKIVEYGGDVTLQINAGTELPDGEVNYYWSEYRQVNPEDPYSWNYVPLEVDDGSVTISEVTETKLIQCSLTDGFNSKTIAFYVIVAPDEISSYPVLEEGQEIYVDITEERQVAWYSFTASDSAPYRISCWGENVVVILDSDGQVVMTNWDEEDGYLEAGQTYYVGLMHYLLNNTNQYPLSIYPDYQLEVNPDNDWFYLEPGQSATLDPELQTNIPYELLTFTWTRNGEPIEADGVVYTTTKAGTYVFEVSYKDMYRSRSFQVEIYGDEMYVYPLTNTAVSIEPFESVRMGIGVSGVDEETLTYQWYEFIHTVNDEGVIWLDRVILDGQTGQWLQIEQADHTANYQVRVEDQYGRTAFQDFSVYIQNGLTMTWTEEYLVPLGGSAEISVEANVNDGEITYQWYTYHESYYDEDLGEWTEAKWALDPDVTGPSYLVTNVVSARQAKLIIRDIYQNFNQLIFDIYVDSGLVAEAVGENRLFINPGDSVDLQVAYSHTMEEAGPISVRWFRTDGMEGNAWYSFDQYQEYCGWNGSTYSVNGDSVTISNINEPMYIICSVEDQYRRIDVMYYITMYPDPTDMLVLEPGRIYSAWAVDYGAFVWYQFTPSETAEYAFKIDHTNINQSDNIGLGILYDSDFHVIGKVTEDEEPGSMIIEQELTAGTTYYLAGGYQKINCPDRYIGVTVFKPIIEKIEIEPVTCYADIKTACVDYWDYDVYHYYWIYDIMPKQIRVTMKDGAIISGALGDVIMQLYDEYQIEARSGWGSSQDEYHPWNVGEHEAEFSYNGYSCKYTVYIEPAIIESMSFEDQEVLGYTHGEMVYPENTAPYWRYYDLSMDLSVTLTDGTSFSGEYYSVVHQLEEHLELATDSINGTWRWLNDTQYENHWLPGGTYPVTVSLLGQECTFDYTITESPLESVEFSEAIVYDHINGNEASDWDENGNLIEFFRYNVNFPDVRVTLKSGEVLEGSFNDVSNQLYDIYGSDAYYSGIYSRQTAQNYWLAGNSYEVPFAWLGYYGTLTVTVEENPFVSIEVEDVSCPEGFDCWYQDDFIPIYSGKPREITVNLRTGETLTGDLSSITGQLYDVFGYAPEYKIQYAGAEDFGKHWEVGSTHPMTFKMAGITASYNVTLTPSLVESIFVPDLQIVEMTRLREQWDSHHYTYNVSPLSITVTMKDGKVFSDNAVWLYDWIRNEYGWDTSYAFDSGQIIDVTEPWQLGIHNVTFYTLGKEYTYQVEIIREEDYEPITEGNGQCGANLFWTLDADGVLTITGTGTMYDYDQYNSSPTTSHPWASEAVKQVILPEGLVKLGNYAFADCSQLTSVELPDTVVKLGDGVFKNCSSLRSITIPEGVDALYYEAFSGCSNLRNVHLPESLHNIGMRSFYACSQLTEIIIPQHIECIEPYAFSGCLSLNKVYFTGDETLRMFAYGCFENVTATCYYPEAYAENWERFVANQEEMAHAHQYNPSGGNLTWVSYSGEIEQWGPWTVIQEPTCLEPGIEQRALLSDPEQVETREISPLYHHFVDDVCEYCGIHYDDLTPISKVYLVTETPIDFENGVFPGRVVVATGTFDAEGFEPREIDMFWHQAENGSYWEMDLSVYGNDLKGRVRFDPEIEFYLNGEPLYSGCPIYGAAPYTKGCYFRFYHINVESNGLEVDMPAYVVNGGTAQFTLGPDACPDTAVCQMTYQVYHEHTVTTETAQIPIVDNQFTVYVSYLEGEIETITFSVDGHTEEIIPGIEPTETETGLTEGKKCSACGEILEEQQVIPTIAVVRNVEYDPAIVIVKEETTITVITSANAQYLRMYTSAGTAVTTWTATAENSVVSGNDRIWTVTRSFSGAGTRTFTFKASRDNVVYGSSKSATVTILSAPVVTSVEYDPETIIVGDATTITVITSAGAEYLRMFTSSGTAVTTWTASEENSVVSGGERIWTVSRSFSGSGTRTFTFKASRDNKTYGDGKNATLQILAAPVVSSAVFDPSTMILGEAATIIVKTSASAEYLRMFTSSGTVVTTWTASDTNSVVNGNERIWTVSRSFTGTGTRTFTFKASKDNKTYGDGKEATLKTVAPKVTSASFDAEAVFMGEAVTITASTSVGATYLRMFDESGTEVTTWTQENSVVSGTERVWTVSYRFSDTESEEFTFKASIDNKTFGEGKTAALQIISPTVDSVEFTPGTVMVGTAAIITAKTSAKVQYLRMFTTAGTAVTTWTAADNSVVNGDERIWTVERSFSGSGNRTFTFKASVDNTSYGEGNTATLKITLPVVTSAEFDTDTIMAGDVAAATVTTSAEAQYLRVFDSSGAAITTWTAAENSVVSGNERVWTVSRSYTGAGTEEFTFKASIENKSYGEGKTAALVVLLPTVSDAAFTPGTVIVGEPATITVRTSTGAQYLQMYTSAGTAAATWTADENSVISGNERVWTVSRSFSGAGTRTFTFKASADSTNYGDGASATLQILSTPIVSSVEYDPGTVVIKEATTITVKTSAGAQYLRMFTEAGTAVTTWTASDENSVVVGGERIWTLERSFSGSGTRKFTFKASKDNKTYGDGKTETLTILTAPAVFSVEFAPARVTVNKATTITVTTSKVAQYLRMFTSSGTAVTTWTAAENSIVSGNVRIWTVSRSFSGTGTREFTFKASTDNKTYGDGKAATLQIVKK